MTVLSPHQAGSLASYPALVAGKWGKNEGKHLKDDTHGANDRNTLVIRVDLAIPRLYRFTGPMFATKCIEPCRKVKSP